MKKGLLEKLARGSRSFLAGAMALGAVYGCEPGTKPTQKPTANFTANPKDGYAPLNVCFNGSSSQAPGSSIAKYIWRFENGSVDSTSGVNVCHTYENPGNHSAGLTVEDAKGERSSQRLEQIVSRDASPVISIPSFSFNEDESYSLDLAGKITSPIYNANSLTITATSPDLKIVTNGLQDSVTNKTKDWNGSTYIDWVVRDPDGRQTNLRTNNIIVNSQTDVKGYLEHVLTGQRVSGIPIFYNGVSRDISDANGDFDFQVPNGNDSLRINSNQYYNVKIPVTSSGQDINFTNLQLIERYIDPTTNEDLLTFMKTYMRDSRWSDLDMPIKVFTGSPPSAEYGEAVRRGIMELWQPVVNQWLPPARQIVLAEIVAFDPAVGVRVDYTASGANGWFGFAEVFKKGVIFINPNENVNGVSQTIAHEQGRAFGFFNTPYQNQIMCEACPALPSPFEGLVLATKYKIKQGSIGTYSR